MFSKTKNYKNLQFNLQIMQMFVMRMRQNGIRNHFIIILKMAFSCVAAMIKTAEADKCAEEFMPIKLCRGRIFG